MLMWDKPQMVEGITVETIDRQVPYVFPNTPVIAHLNKETLCSF
jgi:hypothetical protein